jgi:hypothetical protein
MSHLRPFGKMGIMGTPLPPLFNVEMKCACIPSSREVDTFGLIPPSPIFQSCEQAGTSKKQIILNIE